MKRFAKLYVQLVWRQFFRAESYRFPAKNAFFHKNSLYKPKKRVILNMKYEKVFIILGCKGG